MLVSRTIIILPARNPTLWLPEWGSALQRSGEDLVSGLKGTDSRNPASD